MVGSAFVAEGPDAVISDGLIGKVAVPAVVAPVLAFVVAGIAILLIYRIIGGLRPGSVTRGFKAGQILSGGLLALAHGTNDAQKTMGIITLALVANGQLEAGADPPTWVVVSAATAIALGTYMGGWRIIRTMGSRIIKMDTAQGFAAQGSGAAVILAASHVGFPLSTTHTISGGVMGAGAAKRLSAVRWGVAGQHRRGLGAHHPRGRADRRGHLRGHARLRDGRGGAARGGRGRRGRDRRGVRAPRAAGLRDHGGRGQMTVFADAGGLGRGARRDLGVAAGGNRCHGHLLRGHPRGIPSDRVAPRRDTARPPAPTPCSR